MEKELISFQQINQEHRRERAQDSLRIALHQATPKQIQDENSWIPDSVEIRIPSLLSYAHRHYSHS